MTFTSNQSASVSFVIFGTLIALLFICLVAIALLNDRDATLRIAGIALSIIMIPSIVASAYFYINGVKKPTDVQKMIITKADTILNAKKMFIEETDSPLVYNVKTDKKNYIFTLNPNGLNVHGIYADNVQVYESKVENIDEWLDEDERKITAKVREVAERKDAKIASYSSGGNYTVKSGNKAYLVQYKDSEIQSITHKDEYLYTIN